MITSNYTIFGRRYSGDIVLDPDVDAYFLANGITNTTIKTAVNTFVLGLKSNSIYTKFKSIHFLFMGSAFANKFNLINPLDTDVAHRLVYSGSFVYGSTGIIPNGYIDTKVNSLSHINPTNNHFAIYSRSNLQNDGFQGMAVAGQQTIQLYLRGGYYTNESHAYNGNPFQNVVATGQTSSIGFYLNNRRTSTSLKLFKNGNQIGSENTASSVASVNQNLFLGARNLNGSANNTDLRELSYCSIGQGFTDSEALIYSNLLQTLLTTLSI